MKTINNNAPVKCSKTILINAAPEKVWVVMADIDRWSNWQKDIGKSKLNGKLQVNATFEWKSGGATIHSTLHTVEPNKSIGWTGKSFGTLAIHNWVLNSINGSTQVSVEESIEGLLAKLFKAALNRSLEKGMTNWLALLKAECEK